MNPVGNRLENTLNYIGIQLKYIEIHRNTMELEVEKLFLKDDDYSFPCLF
jgi:hypothetical protein